MNDLVFGAINDHVRVAQRALSAAGFATSLDGVFGRDTENAVRDYQRANRLLPDGRIGPRTAAALHLLAGALPTGASSDLAERFGSAVAPATALSPAPAGIKRSCAGLRVSAEGLAFIMAEETGPGSGDVCWPGGHSGVTIGAGYDMRTRRASQIEADMLAAGMCPADARLMEHAAGQDDRGGRAKTWVAAHPRWPGLTGQQEMELLRRVVPDYEAVVHRVVRGALWQYQFDALVSVAYNPARPMAALGDMVDAGAIADAAHDIMSRIGDTPEVARGLAARREREVALFLFGNYGHTPAA